MIFKNDKLVCGITFKYIKLTINRILPLSLLKRKKNQLIRYKHFVVYMYICLAKFEFYSAISLHKS